MTDDERHLLMVMARIVRDRFRLALEHRVETSSVHLDAMNEALSRFDDHLPMIDDSP